MKAGVFKECTVSYVVIIIRKHPFLFSMFMFHLAKFRLFGNFFGVLLKCSFLAISVDYLKSKLK